MRKKILVVVAHPDDEVLGCGGSIARWSVEGHLVHVLVLADGVAARFKNSEGFGDELNKRKCCAEDAAETMGVKKLKMLQMPDNQMDTLPLLEVVKSIEREILSFEPSLVLTHHSGDVNIDHRVVHQAVLAACRPLPRRSVKELMFFEVLSSTEWNTPASSKVFSPNVFVDISDNLDTKCEALKRYDIECQNFPHPRSVDAVQHLARFRGTTIGVEAAEAFELGRLII
ncbi:PIG-L family deacetylase [Candidatus Puniceispirillum sp.]|nr:PIG-L family deacetylase [Candidatus Puniceispirillum sp.]